MSTTTKQYKIKVEIVHYHHISLMIRCRLYHLLGLEEIFVHMSKEYLDFIKIRHEQQKHGIFFFLVSDMKRCVSILDAKNIYYEANLVKII